MKKLMAAAMFLALGVSAFWWLDRDPTRHGLGSISPGSESRLEGASEPSQQMARSSSANATETAPAEPRSSDAGTAAAPTSMLEASDRQAQSQDERRSPQKQLTSKELARRVAELPEDQVTSQERHLLEMYVGMVATFEEHDRSCKELGAALKRFAEDNQQAPAELNKARSSLSAAAQTQASGRLQQVAGEELAAMRQAIRRGVGRCGQEPRIMEAMRLLAGAGRTS